MATYTELYDLRSDSSLLNRITVAAVVKAQSLIDGGTPTVDEITWANNTIMNPRDVAESLINYVLAANKAASVATIQGASDSAIQTNVDNAADALIAGGA